jgi:hypothetical protein
VSPAGAQLPFGLVLRRALRHQRVRHGDEDAVAQPPVDDHVAARLEEVRHGALVDDRDGGSPLDVAKLEPKPGGMRVAGRRADDLAHQRNTPLMARELARPQRRRAAAGDGCVQQEDREDGGDRERDDEARWASSTSHPAILVCGRTPELEFENGLPPPWNCAVATTHLETLAGFGAGSSCHVKRILIDVLGVSDVPLIPCWFPGQEPHLNQPRRNT